MKKIYRNIILIFSGLLIALSLSAEENTEKKPWNFNFGIGFNYNKGNTEKIGCNFSIDLERISKINELILNINSFYSETKDKKDINKGDLTLKYDHNFLKKESFFLFIIPSYNEFQDLKFRLQSGAGLKHTFYKSDRADHSLSGAVLYELKQYLADNNKNDLTRLSIRPKLKYSFTETNKVYLIIFYQPNINKIDDYRLLLKFILEFNIYKNLFFEFKINDEYNNIVPEGIQRNDLSLINAVKLKF